MANVDSLTVKLHVDVKTLRDEFAMSALTAIVSNHMSGMEQPKWDSSLAYEYADAMMEARKS